jgi:uncharacterized membrane protein
MAEPDTQPGSAERTVFFTDAVVAIAMTLLILPLLESVSDAARNGLDTFGYLREHEGQLFAFALSFVIISMFWRSHERLFAHVERKDGVLQWLNVAWMFTVVWLPVATALVGSMDTDVLQVALYVGTMLLTSLIMLAMTLWLRRHPELVDPDRPIDHWGLVATWVVVGLFAAALLLAVILPGLGYWSLLTMLLSGPLEALLRRRARGRGYPMAASGS